MDRQIFYFGNGYSVKVTSYIRGVVPEVLEVNGDDDI